MQVRRAAGRLATRARRPRCRATASAATAAATALPRTESGRRKPEAGSHPQPASALPPRRWPSAARSKQAVKPHVKRAGDACWLERAHWT